jgi:hypothetical protein
VTLALDVSSNEFHARAFYDINAIVRYEECEENE